MSIRNGLASKPLTQKSRAKRSLKQERSLHRRNRIIEAAIEILATNGVAGLTHRLVAETAGVSLAATTYYYSNKFEIIGDASNITLARYIAAFERAAESHKTSAHIKTTFRDFAFQLIRNSTDRNRLGSIAWVEIMLDAVRHSESLSISKNWFDEVDSIWLKIAEATGAENPREASRSAIDLIIGHMMITLSLGLSPTQISAVFDSDQHPMDAWCCTIQPTSSVDIKKGGKKSEKTRERIISAAIETLIGEGPAAMSYREIASKAGLTTAAPFYYFPTIAGLLGAAQERLFDDSKNRYRRAMNAIDFRSLEIERLLDFTAAIFQREVTEFSAHNLANYTIWLQAAREPELRPMIWSSVVDQYHAWRRILDLLKPNQHPLDALFIQCLFLGKLIRVLCTGASLTDLADVRQAFSRDIKSIVNGNFWASPKSGTVN